jgi:asparagine synthase (glutamine-hydrolysing)
MAQAIAHRGPDHAGVWCEGGIGLAHNRLAIIDLRPESNQPMVSTDGRHVIVFNGEIYNYVELREQLMARGEIFRTASDTEVLLTLYRVHGAECLHMLRGMFAFAVWDRDRRELFIARDRTGKKPFKYAFVGGAFVFASELKALLRYPGLDRHVDWESVADYMLFGYIPAPGTGFRGISKLPQASAMLVSQRGHKIWSYWDVEYRRKCSLRFDAAKEQLKTLLQNSTLLRLRSDVPLGVFLSGGVDSSLIVALMRDAGMPNIKTFTIGFQNERTNELPFARQVANRFATEHHEFLVDENLLHHLPVAVRAYEEPFADAAGFATYFLSQLARQYVTVALSGEGGDETFAGYHHYSSYLRVQPLLRMPPAARQLLATVLRAGMPLIGPARRGQARLLSSMLRVPRLQAYLELNAVLHQDFRAHEWRTTGIAALIESRMRQHLMTALADAPLDEATYRDQHTYLPYCMNVKVDIASMQHALEVRNPLLDQDVIDFSRTLPPAFKHDGHGGKRILKSIACDYYDAAFVYRRKQGFGVPYGDWLRGRAGEMLRATALHVGAVAPELFLPAEIERLWQRMQAGERCDNVCWALAMLGMWLTCYHGPSNRAQ